MREWKIFICFALCACMLWGCGTKDKELEDDTGKIYFVDKNETKVTSEKFIFKSNDKEGMLKELIEALNMEPENISYKKAKPEDVSIKEYSLNDNGQLTINFESNYFNLRGVSEILCRAAIVKTLCQIDGVDFIEFYVDGQPLVDSNSKPIGFMSGDDFIDNTGSDVNYYQNTTITLFFTNKKGNALIEKDIPITFDGTKTMEQVIIERLIQGPSEEGLYPTLPSDLKLLKTTTRDNICYVDFSSKFLEKLTDVSDEVVIYSVVNSLAELPAVNKVQFKIDGTVRKTFRENIEFDGLFERNLDIVKTEK